MMSVTIRGRTVAIPADFEDTCQERKATLHGPSQRLKINPGEAGVSPPPASNFSPDCRAPQYSRNSRAERTGGMLCRSGSARLSGQIGVRLSPCILAHTDFFFSPLRLDFSDLA